VKSEGVRVSGDVSFPKVKVPGKLRWFTPQEVERIFAELDPKKEFVGRARQQDRPQRGRATQRQDAYDLAVTLLAPGRG
jgi:hypothetical protein